MYVYFVLCKVMVVCVLLIFNRQRGWVHSSYLCWEIDMLCLLCYPTAKYYNRTFLFSVSLIPADTISSLM